MTRQATAPFGLGQRVRTTVDAPAAWPGAYSAPVGTLGTIVGNPGEAGSYGVALDGDPSGLPASYHPDELTAN